MSELIRRSEQTGIELSRNGDLFEVSADGELLVSTSVLNSAEAEFQFEVEQRSEQSKTRLENEKSHFAMQAMRSESFARRAANASKRGGKGGRGGV